MLSHKNRILLPFVLLLALLLSGCAARSVELSGGKVSLSVQELHMAVQPDDLEQLDAFTQLRLADFTGSVCYDELLAWAEAHPEVETHYTVPFPDGREVDSLTQELDLSALPRAQKEEAAALLRYVPGLSRVTLAKDAAIPLETLQLFLEQRPDISYSFVLPLPGGSVSSDAQELRFIGHDADDAQELRKVLPYLEALRYVDLGDEESSPDLGWQAIASLQAERPDVDFDYAFTLYDRPFTTLDETVDLSHEKLRDKGAAVFRAIHCMPKLSYLDMDSCGVDDETMAAVRDLYPDVTVVWRVWFGGYYSARTDAIKILASNPGVGGELKPGTYEPLKYFTKLKYLDVGHQPLLDDISFVSYMPDLEVAILAMGSWSDCTPLADCPHLEFLEIQTTNVDDLTPLSGLKELRHLNIGHLFTLRDISPLYDLDLDRLWIGSVTPIPQEQVEEYQRRHPDCVVSTEGYDPHHMWRWIGIDEQGNPIRDPRYDLLVQQMGYDREEYAFEWVETRGW
ncbi:MAG: hypothetical protein IJ594_01400 [Oscillospiraceae bacterium]|nr:hypothetical protein [Oscillospiraceae bacterium]